MIYHILMPINSSDMARRALQKESDLLLTLEEKINLDSFHDKVPERWPSSNPKMMEILKEILDIFNDEYPGEDLAPASRFQFKPQPKDRAKKLLGIKSVRVKNEWHWTRPKRDLSGAITHATTHSNKDADKIRRQIALVRRPAADRLIAVMKRHNYDAVASTVLLEAGYSRRTVLKMKA